jgi:hypothetical protein
MTNQRNGMDNMVAKVTYPEGYTENGDKIDEFDAGKQEMQCPECLTTSKVKINRCPDNYKKYFYICPKCESKIKLVMASVHVNNPPGKGKKNMSKKDRKRGKR